MRSDRRIDVMKLIVAFRNFAKASNKVLSKKYVYIYIYLYLFIYTYTCTYIDFLTFIYKN